MQLVRAFATPKAIPLASAGPQHNREMPMLRVCSDTVRIILACLLVGLVGISSVSAIESPAESQSVDFAREILPILSNKCFVCHGPDIQEPDALRLDSFLGATSDRGGYRAINPDMPEESEILQRIFSADSPMPPREAEKQLDDRERQLLAQWIRQGGQYAQHWAFVPPKKQPPPDHESISADGSIYIDTYVSARLQAEGLEFAAEADWRTLARRVALVLTGLPPEPAQLADFLHDDQPDAYRRFVDAMLASPRFGEHQARYWLDAVRYGDTHGLHLDNRRGIYPYRDWVVRAFNQNLPLDDFITWQLAGDLLPDPSLEQLVATGFVRMNPSTGEGGALPEEFQAKNNFDRTETLGTALLGMSLTCARCHTHKYDPITQTEYYQLLAFFNSTAEPSMDGNKYIYGPVAKAPIDQTSWSQWNALEAERDSLLSRANELVESVSPSDDEARVWENGTAAERLTRLADPAGPFADSELSDAAKQLAERIAGVEESFTTTLIAQDLDQPRETFVLRRGEYNMPTGDRLEPGILGVMGAFPEDAPRNRMGLAKWLTSPDHPLVARVLINRVWQRVFGDGLVRTPEDFGLQGQQPTHPRLLDWLAVELQQSGWDLKQMMRLMVTSRAFRQESRLRADVDDPENRLLARGPGFRLDAEVLRDMALWASGLMEPNMGGEGVKPYQPPGMWKALAHPSSNTKDYVRDQGQMLYRRSLYVYWKRTSPHPMMTLFDAPTRESSCVRRSRTSTALQSLALLNETQRIEMARKVAERLLREASDDSARLDLLFGWLACRPPTDVEREACRQLVDQLRTRYTGAADDATAYLETGDAPRDELLDPIELATWSQVAVMVLASDVAILLY